MRTTTLVFNREHELAACEVFLMYPNLKLELWKAGIRQNRLAQLLGVDETLLSRVMNGFREPSQDMRSRIAALLQRDESWLFDSVVPESRSTSSQSA